LEEATIGTGIKQQYGHSNSLLPDKPCGASGTCTKDVWSTDDWNAVETFEDVSKKDISPARSGGNKDAEVADVCDTSGLMYLMSGAAMVLGSICKS